MQERVKLSKRDVLAQIEAGMTRKEIAEIYGLPVVQMNKAITALGLSGVRAKKVMFEIVPDQEEIEEMQELVRESVPSIEFNLNS